MVRIKACRLTRNPQLGDPVAWLNLTLADGLERAFFRLVDDFFCPIRRYPTASGKSCRAAMSPDPR
jgi:hypothetical protein